MTRKIVFLGFGAGFLGFLVWGMLGLAPFGNYPGPYGDILNAAAVGERHVLNVVTAVMFDYRGFDTLGEEFILFASVTGVLLLLRHEAGEEDESKQRIVRRQATNSGPAPDDSAVRLWSFGFAGAIVIFGIYIVLTGHLSIGGGFQGGVIISAAWLLIFLACGSGEFHRLSRKSALEWFEAGGAGAYALIGLSACALGKPFLTNLLSLGQTGQLLSSGTILLINCAVGVEVAAGFILLLDAFLRPLESEVPFREP